jgi:uncharacterized membrane protein
MDGERLPARRHGWAREDVNVGGHERLASAVGGGALALYGLGRRDLPGAALAVLGGFLLHRGVTGHCMVYGAFDMDTSNDGSAGVPWLEKQHGPNAVLDASDAIKIEHSVMIARPADELFRFWRNFENLPRIMNHLERVDVLDATRSRWRAKAPAGQSVEWEAIVHNEVEGRLIGWKSAEGAAVPNAGSVHFQAAGPERTVVRVVMEYVPPAGKVGQAVARLFGEEPDQQVRADLRRFKRMMESSGATA